MSGNVPLPPSLPPPLPPLLNTPLLSLCRSLLSWCSLCRVWYCLTSRFFCSWRSLVVSISCFSSALSRWFSMRILAVCSSRHSDACYKAERRRKEVRWDKKRKGKEERWCTLLYTHNGLLCWLFLSWPSLVQPSRHHTPSSPGGTVSSSYARSPRDETLHPPTASREQLFPAPASVAGPTTKKKNCMMYILNCAYT